MASEHIPLMYHDRFPPKQSSGRAFHSYGFPASGNVCHINNQHTSIEVVLQLILELAQGIYNIHDLRQTRYGKELHGSGLKNHLTVDTGPRHSIFDLV
jgi:hypothetical protein